MKLITGFGLIAFFWLALWGGFVAFNEYVLKSGTEVLFYIEQRDPRDFFKGDYVQLQFDINQIKLPEGTSISQGAVVYVSLVKNADGCYDSTGISTTRPAGLFIKGKVTFFINELARLPKRETVTTGPQGVWVDYGIERFYIRENTGAAIEKAVREGVAEGKRLKARVMIDRWGRPLIKGLILKSGEISI
ncbi:TPA: hypothetical protein DDZ86_03955 [Candidatus Dependentiae bacterium]|nr:MAG: hypothetical protein UW09_C0003G0144 [candidate division TM6 bacterium GW2011_GWF2_43_87]HBL98770.1 hypothetical protein [Candidatus Dependentiae bacterium]